MYMMFIWYGNPDNLKTRRVDKTNNYVLNFVLFYMQRIYKLGESASVESRKSTDVRLKLTVLFYI